jgi:hypothetical protein
VIQKMLEPSLIPAIVSRYLGDSSSSLAMVCIIGTEAMASAVVFFTPGKSTEGVKFRHALDIEGEYCTALLEFNETDEPCYASRFPDSVMGIADEIGVDRIACMISMTPDGQVYVSRNYTGLEYTLLEAVKTQLGRFTEIIDGAEFPKRTVTLH